MVNTQTTRGGRAGWAARASLRAMLPKGLMGTGHQVIPGRNTLRACPQTIAPGTFHPGAIELSAMHVRRIYVQFVTADPTRIREFVIRPDVLSPRNPARRPPNGPGERIINWSGVREAGASRDGIFVKSQ